MRATCVGLCATWLLAAVITPFLISASPFGIFAGALISSVFAGIVWTLGRGTTDHAPPRAWVFALKTLALVLAFITAINALFSAYSGAVELGESVRTAWVFLAWSAFLGLNAYLLARFVVWRPHAVTCRAAG